jgi:hypothetical protein
VLVERGRATGGRREERCPYTTKCILILQVVFTFYQVIVVYEHEDSDFMQAKVCGRGKGDIIELQNVAIGM